MIDPGRVPAVDASELLARFILSSAHIRASDQTIKPDAFIPHPHLELSVTRHRDASEAELWEAGRAVVAAQRQPRTLHGRGDVAAFAFIPQQLAVRAAPVRDHPALPDNPNHANVIGWPPDKALQRLKALKIAEQAALVRVPVG